jgi:hypothetical protein
VSVERYEITVERLPAALIGGSGVVRFEWEVWCVDEDGKRQYRPLLVEPYMPHGRTLTRWGARRAARRVLRKSVEYYSQEPERVYVTVERSDG